jgi:hypothetical protein
VPRFTGDDYAVAGVNFASRGNSELDLQVGSAYELPPLFEVDSFDLVTLLDVIGHISDREKLLDLRPGDGFVVSRLDRWRVGFVRSAASSSVGSRRRRR